MVGLGSGRQGLSGNPAAGGSGIGGGGTFSSGATDGTEEGVGTGAIVVGAGAEETTGGLPGGGVLGNRLNAIAAASRTSCFLS
jgi:hypothetical protein